MTTKTTTPALTAAPELTWQERHDLQTSQGNTFYPRVKQTMHQRDWEAVFAANQGAVNPQGHVPDKARSLWDRPLLQIIREALHHDEVCLMPPADSEEILRMFAHAVVEHVRAGGMGVTSGSAAGAFANQLGTFTQDGYREMEDSLEGIYENVELPHYLLAPIAQALDLHALRPLAKGGTAETGDIIIPSFGDWRLSPFARRFRIDEQTLLDDVPGQIRMSLAQIGRAARRVFSDWAWFTILSNPTLALDSQSLFCAGHGNYSPNLALSDSAIGTACASIRGQVVKDATDPRQVTHLNLIPRYLIVPPAQEKTAREALRLMLLDPDQAVNLKLRVESRLGPAGVTNPLKPNQVVTGSDTNWMISCGRETPWILRGTFQGSTGPKLRYAECEPGSGEYGLDVDVYQALSVACTDFRPVYFSGGN